jgi:SAM-dependent methyltransferase
VEDSEAVELIRDAVPRTTGTWADLGAGDGTFTRALSALLGPGSRIYAVDRDARALAKLKRRASDRETITVVADLAQPFELPGLDGKLDGILVANALHYLADARPAMSHFAELLRPGGRLVLIEYDRRRANRWVPNPIDAERVPELAADAKLSAPRIIARRPSAYGGDLYVAVMERP